MGYEIIIATCVLLATSYSTRVFTSFVLNVGYGTGDNGVFYVGGILSSFTFLVILASMTAGIYIEAGYREYLIPSAAVFASFSSVLTLIAKDIVISMREFRLIPYSYMSGFPVIYHVFKAVLRCLPFTLMVFAVEFWLSSYPNVVTGWSQQTASLSTLFYLVWFIFICFAPYVVKIYANKTINILSYWLCSFTFVSFTVLMALRSLYIFWG